MLAKIYSCLLLFTLFIHCIAFGQTNLNRKQPELRYAEPPGSIISDLKSYIPGRMAEGNVPGLSIALIRDFQIVWSEGFGVTDKFTKNPVTPETVFEVASISKPVTACIALRLVDAGILDLDTPVHTQIQNPWLPSSEYGDKITLRHLLSHSSGLGDGAPIINKTVLFEPGSAFKYSGTGFLYVQDVIEQATGKSLEQNARELVFGPLNMTASSFINRPDVKTRLSNGHMRFTLPLIAFLLPFFIIFTATWIIVQVIKRLGAGNREIHWNLTLGTGLFALTLTELLLYLLMGKPFPNLVVFELMCAAAVLIFLILLYVILKRLYGSFPRAWHKKGIRGVFISIWMIMSIMILIRLSGTTTVPVPKLDSNRASAIGSLRSSAPDLAAFLIELAKPRLLSDSLASQMVSVQTPINRDFSWGLGPGIIHTPDGDALWQNGITFAFKSVMVIYPTQGFGVVALTNSELGLPAAYDVAAHALGGQAKWKDF